MLLRLEDIAKVIVGKWLCAVDGQQIDITNEEVMTTYRNHLFVSIKTEVSVSNDEALNTQRFLRDIGL